MRAAACPTGAGPDGFVSVVVARIAHVFDQGRIGDGDVGPLLRAVARAVAALNGGAADAASWSAADRRSTLEELDRAVAGLTTVRSFVLVAEREAGTWTAHGDRSFAAWVGRTTRAGDRVAARQVAQADALVAMPGVAGAVRGGELGSAHLEVLAQVAASASGQVAERLRSPAGQVELIALGRRVDAGAYGKKLAQWVASVDPEHVQRTHDEQRARRYLHVTPTPGGMVLKGLLDSAAGARLQLALDAVSPAPAADDERSSEQRRADALGVLCETVLGLPETTSGAAVRPHVSVVLSESTWTALAVARARAGAKLRGLLEETTGALRDVPAPTDEDGAPLPASEVLRVLCDCELTRVVLDAEGSPVDLGRTRRLYTGVQRRAVIARDGGCGWPGCGTRARYGEVHHIAWWDRDGGATSLANAVMLCSFHHHEVHRRDLRIEREPGGAAPPGERPRTRYRFRRRDGSVVAEGEPTGAAPTRLQPMGPQPARTQSTGPQPARTQSAGPQQRAVRSGPPDRDGRAVSRLRRTRDVDATCRR